jgi:hypothetical protein
MKKIRERLQLKITIINGVTAALKLSEVFFKSK